MKYLKFSGVLIALFFAVGCGTKSVEKDGKTTKATSEPQTIETQQAREPGETVTNSGGRGLPEAGFMPDNNGSGSGDTYGGDDSSASGDNTDGSYAYGYNGNSRSNGGDDSGNADDTRYVQANQGDIDEGDDVKVYSLTAIYFDFDRYNIRPDMKGYIRANADYIKEKSMKSVVLQGNTDEFGGDEYNTALGLKRALSVRDALVLQGLPKDMFVPISFGMHKPVCKEKTAECYAKNRRTDLVEKQ